MFQRTKYLLSCMRRHPSITLTCALALTLGLVGAGFGANYWALQEFARAGTALEDERYDEARQHIQWCLRIWPTSARTRLLASRIERFRGDYPKAESYLNECIRLQGRPTEESQLEWLLLRAERGEMHDVEEGLWYAVVHDDPHASSILEATIRASIREARFPLAITCLNKWLERDPKAVRALDWRGWVYERMNRPEIAAQDYSRALELAPGRSEVRIRLVEIILSGATPLDALPHLEYLQKTIPDRVEVMVGLARCMYLQGNVQDARDLFDKALAVNPKNQLALVQRAKLELDEGQAAEAELFLKRDLAEDPYDLNALRTLHKCLAQQGGKRQEEDEVFARYRQLEADKERLDTLLRIPVDSSPGNADLACEIASLFLRIGQEGLGRHWLDIALTKDSSHQPAHEALAKFYERHKEPELAAEQWRLAGKTSGGPPSSPPSQP